MKFYTNKVKPSPAVPEKYKMKFALFPTRMGSVLSRDIRRPVEWVWLECYISRYDWYNYIGEGGVHQGWRLTRRKRLTR